MIIALIAYSILVAGLAGLTALAAEATLRAGGRPGRVPWVGAIAVAVSAPVMVPFFPDEGILAIPVGVWNGSMTVLPTDRVAGFAALDPLVALVCLLASGALAAALATTAMRLQRWRHSWRSARLEGTTVLVSRHVGPAVIGLWNGQIVVPEWAFDTGDEAIGLLVEHERQHLLARDHRLLGFGVAALVLMPWNLPLWWMVARLRLAVEVDCDARVLARTQSEVEAYGSLLIAVGQRRSMAPALGIAFSRAACNLEHRIKALTAGTRRHGLRRGLVRLGLTAVSFSLLCLAPHPVIQVCEPYSSLTASKQLAFRAHLETPTVLRVLDPSRP